MQALPGFELARVAWRTAGMTSYEARSVDGDARLLVLQSDEDSHTADPLARLEQVHAIIDAPGLVLESEEKGRDDLLPGSFRWDDAIPLEEFFGKSELSLGSALEIVRQCALILDSIHRHHGVHGALSVRSILWSCGQSRMRLADLSFIALPQLSPLPHPENEHHEVLLCRAPEASGLTGNGEAGVEGDLYSLGAILYRLIVGRPPFETESDFELTHYHLAVVPVAPSEANTDIPRVISALVMRLLEKLPEHRYRSARSLADDLELCIRALEDGQLHTQFELSGKTPPTRFRLSSALFGRSEAIARLQSAYEARRDGGRGLVLVRGLSGVGKTALVDTLRRRAALDGGVFASGKFPQQQSNQPFVGVVAALQDIVRFLLGLPNELLEAHRSSLLADLGSRLSLIMDLVPELEIAIDKELSRPDPPPGKEREWLVDACQRLIRQFAAEQTPLVLFIDDVQWMDEGSRELLESLLADHALQNFLLVLAYRTREGESSELLQKFLQSSRDVETEVLELEALSLPEVTHLLSETLVATDPPLEDLAAGLFKKTAGNPLFLRRLLESLHHEGQLWFEPNRELWLWNEDAILASSAGENVVDFLVARLKSYDTAVMDLLHLLSCMDGRQTLRTIAEVSGLAAEECSATLALPLADGTLIRTIAGAEEAIYAFTHDRLEQAAYSIFDDQARPERHLKVALALMARERRTSTTAFHIATQLERAGPAALSSLDPTEMGRCYLDAAEQARQNAAYDSSRRYVAQAREHIADDAWESNYNLTLRLNRLRAELRYQKQDFKGSRRLLHYAIGNCTEPLRRADLYSLLIVQATLDGSHDEAIIDGRNALNDLGFSLPSSGYEEALNAAMQEMDTVDVNDRFEGLLDLPRCNDPSVEKIMDVLMVLLPPTFFLHPALNNHIAVMMTKLTLEHGVCRASPKGLVNYGTAIVERGRYREGFLFGELAVQLADKHGFQSVKPRVLYTYAGGLNHWVNPLQSTPTIVDQGRALCTELGERDYEGYLLTLGRCQNEVFLGQPIAPFRAQVQEIIELVTEVKNDLGRGLAIATHLCLAHLAGETDGPESFDTEGFTEAELLAATQESRTQLVDCFYFTLKAQNLYLLGHYDSASESIQRAVRHADRLAAPMGLAVLPVLVGLIAVERALMTDDPELRMTARVALDDGLSKLSIWASECPHNFGHLEAMLKGASARLNGQLYDAVAHFSESVARASRSRFVQFEGMAHQNLARIWAEASNEYYQAVHQSEARRCFRAWGAVRLVANDGLLEMDASSVLLEGTSEQIPSATGISSGAMATESMALVSMMGRLSAEAEGLEPIKKDLITIVAQASGASKAVLIMQTTEHLEPVLNIEVQQSQVTIANPTYPAALVNRAARMRKPFVIQSGIVEGESVQDDPYLAEFLPASALCIPLLHQGVVEGVLYVENRTIPMDLSSSRRQLVEILAAQAALSIRNAMLYQERQQAIDERTEELSRLNAELSAEVASQKQELAALGRMRRFLSPRVASYVEREDGWEQLARSRREIAVIFCDLRDFALFASWSQPEQQHRLQTEYRTCLDELFLEYDATVDHWEGDGAMVFLGAPEPFDPATAAIPRAVDLAFAMRDAVHTLVESWGRLDISPRGFGVGVTYGTCWVGLSGQGWRVDYNAGGAYVNLAARLCSAAGAGEILITNAVRSHLDVNAQVWPLQNQALRGIDNPGEIFRI